MSHSVCTAFGAGVSASGARISLSAWAGIAKEAEMAMTALKIIKRNEL